MEKDLFRLYKCEVCTQFPCYIMVIMGSEDDQVHKPGCVLWDGKGPCKWVQVNEPYKELRKINARLGYKSFGPVG